MIIINAPHFCAAVVLDERGTVELAAPILRYMIGWSGVRVVQYCDRKGWKTSII